MRGCKTTTEPVRWKTTPFQPSATATLHIWRPWLMSTLRENKSWTPTLVSQLSVWLSCAERLGSSLNMFGYITWHDSAAVFSYRSKFQVILNKQEDVWPPHLRIDLKSCTCRKQLCKLLTVEPSIFVVKAKTIPIQALTGPEGSRRLRLPVFKIIGTWRW
jgi:hypothetical protein